MLVIFLLAVVSLLAVSVMNLSTTQHMSSLFSYRGSQAYFAAHAGMEYGIDRIVNNGGECGYDRTFTLAGHDVNVICTVVMHPTCGAGGTCNEGRPTAFVLYNLQSTATDGGFQVPDAVTRRLRATIKNP